MKVMPSVILLASALPFTSYANECGEFTIADMNWNSASLIAHIDQFILNEGYACDAQLIPGDSVPTGRKANLMLLQNSGRTASKKR